ncbi:hypothetical protein E1I69_05035 [Bacillus timonensis]|uniref:DUF304 domain-containing protein n=1 Tax=Bacillus timonensis TaxID=1033734 RepID=A0A4S3PWF5_9BACI|nr:DUF5381 family protein [Bacillus timonensis]THE14179.1 hypothetical protein E1I69_05035 [Bacillus timonensis]
MNNYLIPNRNGVGLVYKKGGAGCLYMGAGVGLIASIVVLIIAGTLGTFKGFIGIIIGVIGVLFTGGAILRLVSVLSKSKVLIKVEDGHLINLKNRVPLADITDVFYGWHAEKLSGGVFQNLVVTTTNGKKHYYSYYNLIPDHVMKQLVEEYILPNANPTCKSEKKRKNSSEILKL